MQHSRQNWPDRGWCWAGKNTRDELAQRGHGHIMPSQTSVVPAGNHTIFLQQLARSKPVVPRPFDVFVCVFQGTERWTSKSSLLQVLISIQGKCSCGTCGAGGGRGQGGCGCRGDAQLGCATPAGLLLPFALTSLDKAASLSLRFSSPGRCELSSRLEFWLRPRSLRQCFPFFWLQQLTTELFCLLGRADRGEPFCSQSVPKAN